MVLQLYPDTMTMKLLFFFIETQENKDYALMHNNTVMN